MIPVIMLSLSLSRYVININRDYFDKNVDSSVNFLMGREYNLTNLSVNVNIKMYKKWKIKMYNLGSTIHQLSYHQ